MDTWDADLHVVASDFTRERVDRPAYDDSVGLVDEKVYEETVEMINLKQLKHHVQQLESPPQAALDTIERHEKLGEVAPEDEELSVLKISERHGVNARRHGVGACAQRLPRGCREAAFSNTRHHCLKDVDQKCAQANNLWAMCEDDDVGDDYTAVGKFAEYSSYWKALGVEYCRRAGIAFPPAGHKMLCISAMNGGGFAHAPPMPHLLSLKRDSLGAYAHILRSAGQRGDKIRKIYADAGRRNPALSAGNALVSEKERRELESFAAKRKAEGIKLACNMFDGGVFVVPRG
jgi:hypothetical protein